MRQERDTGEVTTDMFVVLGFPKLLSSFIRMWCIASGSEKYICSSWSDIGTRICNRTRVAHPKNTVDDQCTAVSLLRLTVEPDIANIEEID